jgi:imidazolonepropionase-like amidohydrolase
MPRVTDPVERIQAMVDRANAVADSGADWLKIFATTGTADDLTGEQIYSYVEIKAATDTAHGRGLKVALHAYGPSAVPDAIRAGVDSIEHAVDVDDATLQTWAAARIAYVPTIDHNRYYADHRSEYGYNGQTAEALHTFTVSNVAMLQRAHQAGIPIVFGSDAVMSMFGQNSRELEWFALAGLSPAEIIRTATLNAAHLLGRDVLVVESSSANITSTSSAINLSGGSEDELGANSDSIDSNDRVLPLARLAPGYAADIIAVEGNPLEDVSAITRRVNWVMKGGEVQEMSP